MKVVNRTRWRTDHLRAFAVRAAQEELDPAARKRFTMEVRYSRGGGISGCAAYHSRRITVRVPSGRGRGSWPGVDRVDLAHTIAHEMAHTRGMTHLQMGYQGRETSAARYQRVGNWRALYAWAETLPLELTPAKARPSLDARRAAKLATARIRLAAWEQNVRHAETFRKKWARTVRRLEAVEAKAALGPGHGGKE